MKRIRTVLSLFLLFLFFIAGQAGSLHRIKAANLSSSGEPTKESSTKNENERIHSYHIPSKSAYPIHPSAFIDKDGLLLGKTVKKQNHPSTTPKNTDTEAVLMFTGDLMCLNAQQTAARQKKAYDFTDSFSYVKQIFERSDLLVGNLETQISTSNPLTSEKIYINNQPNCNGPSSYLDAVTDAGFDCVVTANNHCMDGGLTGALETLHSLDSFLLPHTGTFSSNETDRYLLCDANGITVAILSYTELINNRNALSAAKMDKYVNCYSAARVKSDIAKAKEAGAEFIIVYNHWGTENTHVVTSTQTADAKAIADAGADLIIGSHPHCLQQASYIRTADDREVLCMYSMGNFLSSMTREINQDTIILSLTLKRTNDVISYDTPGYYPCHIYRNYKKQSFIILPISKDLNGGVKTKDLAAAEKRIKKVIGDSILCLNGAVSE